MFAVMRMLMNHGVDDDVDGDSPLLGMKRCAKKAWTGKCIGTVRLR